MNTNISEQSIKALFEAEEEPLITEDFTSKVLAGTERIKKRTVTRRVLLGVALFLLSIPLEEYVLGLSQILLVSLYEMQDGLAAQILAPINSVGGLLSAILLTLRAGHKKVFRS